MGPPPACPRSPPKSASGLGGIASGDKADSGFAGTKVTGELQASYRQQGASAIATAAVTATTTTTITTTTTTITRP